MFKGAEDWEWRGEVGGREGGTGERNYSPLPWAEMSTNLYSYLVASDILYKTH